MSPSIAAWTPHLRQSASKSRRQSTDPALCDLASNERSCSLTMMLTLSEASDGSRSEPMLLSEEKADHVGAYSTVGCEGSRPRAWWIWQRFSDPSTRQSALG